MSHDVVIEKWLTDEKFKKAINKDPMKALRDFGIEGKSIVDLFSILKKQASC